MSEQGLRFVRFPDLGGVPNVVVDGSAGADTRLVLSHWPGSRTPEELRDDLSAQIALRALEHPAIFEGIDAVSNNHFDQDGLMSVYALLHPDGARRRRDLLIDVARAGDFGWYEERAAARIAITIAAMSDPATSPLDPGVFEDADVVGALYEACLATLPELLDHPERTRELWVDEDAYLSVSEQAIRDGVVTMTERSDVDLATFHVPDEWTPRAAHRFTVSFDGDLHPMAVNGATRCLRVLTCRGRRARLECRYETWVQLVSRPVLPRPDLRDLAAELDALEGDARWSADPPGALTPVLRLRDGTESSLAPERLESVIETWLRAAPAAWDPWASR